MLRGIANAYRDNPEYYTREVNRINLRTLYLLPVIGIPASIFNIVAHVIMMRQASQRNGYLLLAYYVILFMLTRCLPQRYFRRGLSPDSMRITSMSWPAGKRRIRL